ncbi:MAG: hypothetical protein HEQ32_04720 [Vampirovibrio sp.]
MKSEALKDNASFRFDAEYFKKEYLKGYIKLESKIYEYGKEIATIRSGTTPSERDDLLTTGVILLKTNDIRNNLLLKNEAFFYIDEDTNKKMKSTQLKQNDVLFNIVGATTKVIGRSAIVLEDFPKSNITQAMAFFRLISQDYTPSFLFIFLQTYYGQLQVRRLARPTGQFNLNLEELGKFVFPLLSNDFQKQIEVLVKQAYSDLQASKQAYAEAEAVLLDELGLADFTPSTEAVSIKGFAESFGSTGRLDAEYYQPKYEALEKRLNGFPTLRLKDLGSVDIYLSHKQIEAR